MCPPARILAALGLCAGLWLAAVAPAEPAGAPAPGGLPRVVSLNPSLTSILLALDAGEALVGVDDRSARDLPQVADLPQVGGLFNPSVEGILALEPDLVVWVPSAQQRQLRQRLETLGVEVLELPNITWEEVLACIVTLGERVGRGDAARARVDEIRRRWRRAEAASQGRERPRTVLVLQRDPLYVVGGGSFLDTLLQGAGAENLGAGFAEPYPRVGVEWLIAARPELILDAAPDPEASAEHWARWPSLAGARDGVVQVPAERVILPGPYLDRAMSWLSKTVDDALARRRDAAEPSAP